MVLTVKKLKRQSLADRKQEILRYS
jgi:hypothetical protein